MKHIKHIIYCFFLLIIITLVFSCSNDDNPNNPNNPEVETIGLKFYGKEASSDRGIRIFKTEEGYISFEIQNDFSPTAEGYSDIIIRKLDEKLELTSTNAISNSSFDQIIDVAKIDDNRFAVVGSTGTVTTSKFPVIRIFNTNGEVLQSLIIGSPQTNANTNNGVLVSVFYKDNILYTTVGIKGFKTSIIALDLDLNLLWSKLYTTSSIFSNLIVDNTHVYMVYSTRHDLNNKTVILRKLDKANGDEVYQKEYNNVEGDFSFDFFILKIIQDQNYLFLAGLGGRKKGSSNSNISQGIILKINKSDGIEMPRMVFPETFSIRDIEFYENGFITSSETRGSFIRISKLNNEGAIVWKYEYNQRQNDYVNDLGINSDNSVFFTGSVDQGNNDRDVIYGILKSDGKLK